MDKRKKTFSHSVIQNDVKVLLGLIRERSPLSLYLLAPMRTVLHRYPTQTTTLLKHTVSGLYL
jgi:hypothetical protein